MGVQQLPDLAGFDHFVGYKERPMLKIAGDLWRMYYGPDGYFDQAGCDIRLALYKGKLADLAKGE